jgi:hypothetical protein
MNKWVDQFGCHTSQFCLVVGIAMPMLIYRSWNLLKWIFFKKLTWISTWCTKSFYTFKKIVKVMDFWTQNSWNVPLTTIFFSGLWYGPSIDGVCVEDLKLVRYHNKEVKCKKKINWILGLYLWTFEWANKKHFFISSYYIGRRGVLWYFHFHA